MKKLAILLLVVLTSIYSQDILIKKGLEAITPEAIQGQLEFLSSDWMEGRETGQKGQYLAADYIASMFKVYGLMPAAGKEKSPHTYYSKNKHYDENSYYQDFYLNEYEAGENQQFSVLSENNNPLNYNFKYMTDFRVRTSEIPQEINAEVVFAGYAFQSTENNYDDLEDIDVNGKVVVLLRGFPGHTSSESEAYKKFKPSGEWWWYRLEREKRTRLEKLGALAIIEIDPEKDAVEFFKSNTPFRYQQYPYYEGNEKITTYGKDYEIISDNISTNIPTIYLSNRAVNILLKDDGIQVQRFEENTIKTLKPDSKKIKNKRVKLVTDVNSKIISTRNVLGMIEGESRDSIIVIGGHYDHEGMRNGIIYNGADDNGSGTVGVLTIAKAFASLGVKPKKTIIFAAWTGEERGLLGSEYFVANPPEGHIEFYFNMDMLSRSNNEDTLQNRCFVRYTDTYPILKEMNEKLKAEYSFDIDFQYEGSPKPRGGSDFASFAEGGIPVSGYFTGLHDEYHTPLDQEELVNYNKMIPLVKMAFLNLFNIANNKVRLQK